VTDKGLISFGSRKIRVSPDEGPTVRAIRLMEAINSLLES
jgi:hypothetical protein